MSICVYIYHCMYESWILRRQTSCREGRARGGGAPNRSQTPPQDALGPAQPLPLHLVVIKGSAQLYKTRNIYVYIYIQIEI